MVLRRARDAVSFFWISRFDSESERNFFVKHERQNEKVVINLFV